MKKVLQLSLYPIVKPLHGGQIRVSQIRKFFEGKNCIVKSLSVTVMSHEHYSDDDYLVSDYDIYEKLPVSFCDDYAISLMCDEGKIFRFLHNKILDFDPDLILVEQAWLWPAVKKVKQNGELKPSVKILYSSHNTEYKTKKFLFDEHDMNDEQAETVIKGIYNLEKELCFESDITIACTISDIQECKELGSTETILAPNGVAKRPIDAEVSKSIQDSICGYKFVLFIGSAYPPNAAGFWKLLGTSLAWLPPEHVIFVVGGVSKIIDVYKPDNSELFNHVAYERIKKIGQVSEEILASLIDTASVIIMPITIGGGSNLKTAEAIASGKPVVATTKACRGFDFIDKLSNFYVADDSAVFINHIQNILSDKNITNTMFSEEEQKLRKQVYWENTLISLEKLLG